MTARAAAHGLLQRLADATPTAWRQDPVFRGAAVGVGVTGTLLLLRLVGPQAPELQLQTLGVMPPAAPSLPGRVGPPAAEVPKIAPGHSLDDVTVVPAPDGDRFGTFKPGTRP